MKKCHDIHNKIKESMGSIAIFYIIIAPLLLYIFRSADAGTLMVIALCGILAFIITVFDDVELFEISSLKVKLKRELLSANELTKQLRQLAITVTHQLVADITWHGDLSKTLSFEEKLRRIDDLKRNLENMSNSETEIRGLFVEWDKNLGHLLYHEILREITNFIRDDKSKAQIFSLLKFDHDQKHSHIPIKELETFIPDEATAHQRTNALIRRYKQTLFEQKS